MRPEYAPNWYTFQQVREITGESARTLRTKLSRIPPSLFRSDPAHTGPGRPPNLYHFTAHPRLTAHHKSRPGFSEAEAPAAQAASPTAPDTTPIAHDDLARGQLRLEALLEYLARRTHATAEAAADATLADWRRNPRTKRVQITERLPRGHTRKHTRTIGITLSRRSLDRWTSTYKETASQGTAAVIAALAPKAKRNPRTGKGRGRKAVPIPDELLQFVYGLSASTARADVAKGVAKAQAHWPADDWPQVSIATWRRRILALDPRKAAQDLSHSIQRFRANHSGDIETDWNALPYNALWFADDVQEDWYAHGTADDALIRPYAYSIQRASTRQWVALYVSECPITHDQLRELIGYAFADPQGGLPAAFTFEHGTVACPPGSDLESLLLSLGIRVQRTSQDNGNVHPGAFPDPGNGHPQGKAPIERSMRAHHDAQWDAPAQVGPEQRHTAPARLQAMLKASQARRDAGDVGLFLPGPHEWPARVRAAVERYNNAPHQGLPQLLDPDTGKVRHASPNEIARRMHDQAVRVMDPRLLPLFTSRGVQCPVTRNGIRINNLSYGRFDDDLQQFRSVKAYVSDTHPDIAYIYELGRCVERYRKAPYGDASQIETKRAAERAKRNKWEAAVAQVLAQGRSTLPGSVSVTQNPVPDRPAQIVAPDIMLDRANAYTSGLDRYREAQAAASARFDPPKSGNRAAGILAGDQESSSPRRGLLSRQDELASQLAVLSSPDPQPPEPDPWPQQ